MTWKARLLLRESVFTAVAFTAAIYVYYVAAVWGMQDFLVDGALKDYLVSPAVHVEMLTAGVLFGGLLGVISRVTERPEFRARPVVQVVALRVVMYLLGFGAVAGVVFLAFATFIYPMDVLVATARGMSVRSSLSFGIWIVLSVAVISLALEVERVLGPGNLWRLFVGRYRRPREEDRVFLFMDLEGSTSLAETLGHLRYSELLQECYRDLTQVVLPHEAEIYQYVGDEVVMSWPSDPPQERRRDAVRTYFAYERLLRDRADEYEARFGAVPRFRGGIDVGPVTAIEVGDVKREIVYHGDVLNTAARLLETCKRRNDALLASGPVGEVVEGDPGVRVGWHGPVALRGKRDPVEAYSLVPVPSQDGYHP